MNIKILIMFISCFFINSFYAMDRNCLYPLPGSCESKFRFFLVPEDPRLASFEVSLSSIRYDCIYEIYDDRYAYGFYRCLAPYLFAHVDNINSNRKRFLNIQTGVCLDYEPILKFPEQQHQHIAQP